MSLFVWRIGLKTSEQQSRKDGNHLDNPLRLP